MRRGLNCFWRADSFRGNEGLEFCFFRREMYSFSKSADGGIWGISGVDPGVWGAVIRFFLTVETNGIFSRICNVVGRP